jgi:hypothetical protein
MSHASWVDSLAGYAARAHARRQYKQFERLCARTAGVQDRALQRRIAAHADSGFGREHGFDRIGNYRNFISRVPVRTYEELWPYVKRVIAGDSTALLGSRQRLMMLALTSGSTDSPKHVPITADFVRDYRRGWNIFGGKAMLDHPDAFLRPILQVVSPMDEHRSEGGFPCGSISGLLAATAKPVVRRFYAVPPETAAIEDAEARYYAIMRFAVPRDVGWMVTASPATPIKLARTAAQHAERLIRDIHDGTLRPPGGDVGSAADQLQRCLRPDRVAARRLATILDTHGELAPRYYWDLAFLANWTGGTLGLHLRDFPRYFGNTPIRDIGLLATEGRVSIPLEDGTPAGPLDVGGSFFEFIDAEAGTGDASAVHRAHELTVGNEYRVVLTTSAGFIRYDLGDRVVVRGHRGEAPVIEFLHRGANVSSMTGEKLTEWQVTTAFTRSCKLMDGMSMDFALAPVWSDPPYYRLHVSGVTDERRLAEAMDRELAQLNVEYASKRDSQRLGRLQVNRLPAGVLEKRIGSRPSRSNAAAEQFKRQYLHTKPGDDDDLPVSSGTVNPIMDAERDRSGGVVCD